MKRATRRKDAAKGKPCRRRGVFRDSALVRELRSAIRARDEQIRFFRKQFHFMQGKIERLELAAMSATPNPAGQAYVARADAAIKPAEVPQLPKRPLFSTIREKWDQLTEAEQEKYMLEGNWVLDESEDQNARSDKSRRKDVGKRANDRPLRRVQRAQKTTAA